MPKRFRASQGALSITINLAPRESDRFLKYLAALLADSIMKGEKARKPQTFTLEKPETKTARKRAAHKGPAVYRSKDVDFSLRENRVRETKALIRKKARKMRVSQREAATMLTRSDFRKNGCGMLAHKLKDSPFRAVAEAVPEFGIMPWEMKTVPKSFWKMKQNRKAATLWLLGREGKGARDITKQDFLDYGMGKMLAPKNGKSIYNVLVEAGKAYSPKEIARFSETGAFIEGKAYPWELVNTPHGYFGSAKNRIPATRWLVHTSKKDPKDITYEDFEAAGMRRLVESGDYPPNDRHGNSRHKAALREAGFDV